MKVIALVGASGTGKSHHSMWVAKKYDVDCLIDDGLLISKNSIIAGKSAKSELSKLASVRRAIFSSPEHALDVKNAICREGYESVLVIGTSTRMTENITCALDLPSPEETIYIEDVATPEEIEVARKIRFQQGKHVIPAPTFEVKKQFSGYFMHPLKLLFKRKSQTLIEEKTVMRPVFSYMGGFRIKNKVIHDICIHALNDMADIKRILSVEISSDNIEGIEIIVNVCLQYPNKFNDIVTNAGLKMVSSIESMTALNVKKMKINIKRIEM